MKIQASLKRLVVTVGKERAHEIVQRFLDGLTLQEKVALGFVLDAEEREFAGQGST